MIVRLLCCDYCSAKMEGKLVDPYPQYWEREDGKDKCPECVKTEQRYAEAMKQKPKRRRKANAND